MTKVCTVCNLEKDTSLFSVNRANKTDGLTKDCKECRNKKNAEYRLKNPEKESLRWMAYNRRNKDKISQKNKAWYQSNYVESDDARKKVRFRQSVYRMSDKGRATKNNIENKRRAKLSSSFHNSSKEATFLLKTYMHTCYYCNCNLSSMHIDHFIPISQNGRHSGENLVASCVRCNTSKKDKSPYAFIGKVFINA